MFSSKKSLRLIDYQDSYYYRQQRKKRRNKWLKLSFILLFIVLLILFIVPLAQSSPYYINKQNHQDNAYINGPQLIFEHPNPAMAATSPIDIKADIEVNGLVAYAELKQTFINPHAVELEGKYQFPLPENAAVKQLLIQVGNKEIVGKIMEKRMAKAVYRQAKSQGKKASLLEQHRPNLFINKIANIPANSTVVVTLKFIMPVSFSKETFNFTLPLAMTDRYQPQPYIPLSAELSTSYAAYHLSNTKKAHQLLEHKHQQPDFSLAHAKPVAGNKTSVKIALNSGIPITNISSDSHAIKSRELNSFQNAYSVTLDKTRLDSNKGFNLTWQRLASEHPQISSFSQTVSDEYYTLLTFFPPDHQEAKVIARDIIFIVDTSGSMQGQSMQQAKESLQLALLQLNNKDSFNIIAFDDETELLFPITKMASEQNIKTAMHFIEKLNADGGTQMYQPLSNALMMKKNKIQSIKAIRQIVFITDGAVANEFELMQLLHTAEDDFRLYTVGIGAAPNGYFMKKAAQFGRGSYVFIRNQNEIQQKMTNFMTKISQPAISNIEVILDSQVHQNVEIYPKKIPDLHFGDPLQLAIKSQFPISSVQIAGETVSDSWYQQLVIDDQQPAKAISSLWARRKIASLLDSLVVGAKKEIVKSQVIATSINHQIISPYTSFIALEKQFDLSSTSDKNNALQENDSLMVAIPQTSIGWQLQLLIGIALLIFAKISDYIYLASSRLKVVNRHEKHH